MRRALVSLLCASGFGAGAIAVACSFPTVTFAPDDAASSGTGTSGSSGNPSDAQNGGSDSSSSGLVITEDGSVIDSGCLGDPACDCDDDKDKIPECGGGDCDDHDSRRRSTLIGYQTAVPPVGKNGDWNCTNGVEREAEAGVKCSDILDGGNIGLKSIGVLACAREGFTVDLECGQIGTYNSCEFNDMTTAAKCTPKQFDDNRARGCK